jgi:CDP-diacylglycerol--glycerol-3-phosphate 3-phosphatidyltransferase
MNLPNRLTVSRFALTAGFVASMTLGWRGEAGWSPTPIQWGWGFSCGLVLFVAAAVTDYFDGAIARRRQLVTDFGKLMDPLADKVLMAAAFICLIPEHAIPAWAAIVIISREFLITGLRLLAASKGVVLPSEKMGKHKTAWQMVTVIYFLVLLSLAEMQEAGWFFIGTPWEKAWHIGGPILIAVAVVLTLYSGLGYIWKHRRLIATE